MTRKGECYFYGSQHNKIPDDSIKDLISKADYVLLEGFDTRNKWSVLKKQPCAIVIIFTILLYSLILRLILLIRRSPGDMKYVESIATKMGKKTEYVDSSLTEVFLSDSQYVKKLSYRSCIAEVISLSLLLLPKVGIPVIGILAKGLLFLSHLLPKSVVLLIIWIVILASIGTFIGTPIVTFVKFLFSKRGINNSFRDPKVIERARELIERGYNVLIVRGSYHKDFIIRGLQKYSIDCKIVKVIHNNIGYLISRIRIAFYSTVLQLRWCAYLGLLVRRHFKQKRRHRTSKAHEPFGR